MAGEETERKKPGFISNLITTAILVLAAAAIYFFLNALTPQREDSRFDGLVSSEDGRFMVKRDGDLSIDAILYRDYDGNEVPVSFIDNPGHKIKNITLRERFDVQEFDILRTLAFYSIESSELPAVPQLIEVRVSDKHPKGDVALFILTDKPYKATRLRTSSQVVSKQMRFKAQLGKKGLSGFVVAEKTGVFPRGADSGLAQLGEGPVAILMAVKFRGDKPVGRSQLVLVKRKGIVNPGDRWFNDEKAGYFSRPFVGDDPQTVRLAFETPVRNGGWKVIVCTMDFKYSYNISSLFPEGPISIHHWGKSDDEIDILYVMGEFGDNEIYPVKITLAEPLRITGEIPASPEEKDSEPTEEAPEDDD